MRIWHRNRLSGPHVEVPHWRQKAPVYKPVVRFKGTRFSTGQRFVGVF